MSSPRKTSKSKKFSTFSTREQKVIVRYLYYQDVDSSEIHKLLTAACGKEAPCYKDVRDWIQDITEGREEIDDCVCSGGRKVSGLQAASLTDPALVARLETLINADHRISPEKLAELAVTPVQTIQTVLGSLLGLKRVYERWVPRIWTPEQREYRVSVCKQLLDLYQTEANDMLKRIIVGDTSYVLYCSVGENSTNSGTLAPKEISGSKFRPADEPEPVYCAFFFDVEGILVAEPLPNRTPVTAEEYAEILRDQLMPAINRKRTYSKPYYLLHSVVPEHTAPIVQNTLRELQIVSLPNAVASPDLEPFEYWFYRHMNRQLEDLHFSCREELWSAVHKQMHRITDIEYNNSIFRLVDRWNICIEKHGLYLL